MLDCRQVLSELSNYIDDGMTLEEKCAFEEHLARCRRCWVVCDTTRKTIEIVSENMPPAMPLAVSERLHAGLRLLYASRGS